MLFPVELLSKLLERVQYNRQNTHMLIISLFRLQSCEVDAQHSNVA